MWTLFNCKLLKYHLGLHQRSSAQTNQRTSKRSSIWGILSPTPGFSFSLELMPLDLPHIWLERNIRELSEAPQWSKSCGRILEHWNTVQTKWAKLKPPVPSASKIFLWRWKGKGKLEDEVTMSWKSFKLVDSNLSLKDNWMSLSQQTWWPNPIGAVLCNLKDESLDLLW